MECIEHVEKHTPWPLVDAPLREPVRSVFRQRGIGKLYRHQWEALRAFQEGRDVVLSAPTSSGKTEVYLAIAVEEALRGNTTLAVYPTKALARDQLRRFLPFSLYGIRAAAYDGDTAERERRAIRASPPSVLITNFDMLHHILLNHNSFDAFLKRLSFVVVDELHYYAGILGAHASNILQRLERLLRRKYKRGIRYFATSATLSNGQEFARTFFQRPMELIEVGGSAREIRHCIVLHSLPYTSAVVEVLKELEGKTLVFANSHSAVERIAVMAERAGIRAKPYRAGYKQSLRRSLEEAFKASKIDVLVATSALELGIDIGDVDNVVLAGFPPTISSARQRVGRAGRRGQRANAYIVPRDSPLDHYYVDNPHRFFHGEPESIYTNPFNRDVRKWHLLAMAKELALGREEAEKEKDLVEELVREGYLQKGAYFHFPTKKGRALLRRLSIRSAFSNVEIYEGDKLLGTRELWMAVRELFPGAVYLHYGKTYISEYLSLEEGKARVRRAEVDYTTKALSEKDISVEEVWESREGLSYGRVRVSHSVVGFLVKEQGRRVAEHYFDEPYEISYEAEAIWIDVPALMEDLELFLYGLHALEHTLIALSPALAGNDPSELGGLSMEGRIYIHESMPFGMGIAKILFHRFPQLLEMARDRLQQCECERGCPRCIMSPDCGNDNRYLDKETALFIAGKLHQMGVGGWEAEKA